MIFGFSGPDEKHLITMPFVSLVGLRYISFLMYLIQSFCLTDPCQVSSLPHCLRRVHNPWLNVANHNSSLLLEEYWNSLGMSFPGTQRNSGIAYTHCFSRSYSMFENQKPTTYRALFENLIYTHPTSKASNIEYIPTPCSIVRRSAKWRWRFVEYCCISHWEMSL